MRWRRACNRCLAELADATENVRQDLFEPSPMSPITRSYDAIIIGTGQAGPFLA